MKIAAFRVVGLLFAGVTILALGTAEATNPAVSVEGHRNYVGLWNEGGSGSTGYHYSDSDDNHDDGSAADTAVDSIEGDVVTLHYLLDHEHGQIGTRTDWVYARAMAYKAHVHSHSNLMNKLTTAQWQGGKAFSNFNARITVENPDPSKEAKLHIINNIEFDIVYVSEGGSRRIIENVLKATDIHQNVHTASVSDVFVRSPSVSETAEEGGSGTSTSGKQFTIGWTKKNGFSLGWENSISQSWTNTWARSVTTSSQDSPTNGPGNVPVTVPPKEVQDTGTVEYLVAVKGRIEYDETAVGMESSPEWAKINKNKFHVHNDVLFDWALEVDPEDFDWSNGGSAATPITLLAGWKDHEQTFGKNPDGLDGEPGARPGKFGLTLPHDESESSVVYDLSVDPAGRIGLPAEMEVLSSMGTGVVEFTALQAGAFEITATRLDEQGQPTLDVFTWNGTNSSLLNRSAPFLSAYWADIGVSGDDVSERKALRGGDLRLVVQRTGFDDYDVEETVVDISVADASDILEDLPQSVTIPAGESRVILDVALKSTTGQATITLDPLGQNPLEFAVVSESLTLSSALSAVTIPANSWFVLPILLNHPSIGDTDYSWSTTAASIATVDFTGTPQIEDGTGFHVLRIQTGVEGTATLEFEDVAEESPVSELVVTVREANITASTTALTLSDMLAANSGVIALSVPEGVEFDTFTGPTGYESYMEIETSPDDRTVWLTLLEGEVWPDTIECSVTYTGPDSSDPFRLYIDDETNDYPAFYWIVVD